MISVGPTGGIVQGSVMDVAKRPLEEALKRYDPLLYLKWNPKKLKRHGCWELRRRSETKTVVDIIPYRGAEIVRIDFHELDIVNHIKDLPTLDYTILDWVKAKDTWNMNIAKGNVAAQAERNLDYHAAQVKAKAREQMQYELKQNRHAWRDLRDMVLSGMSPAEIARYWNNPQ